MSFSHPNFPQDNNMINHIRFKAEKWSIIPRHQLGHCLSKTSLAHYNTTKTKLRSFNIIKHTPVKLQNSNSKSIDKEKNNSRFTYALVVCLSNPMWTMHSQHHQLHCNIKQENILQAKVKKKKKTDSQQN
ncbi:hypothetical protein Droror1_Dr00016474 [Drosera rotundifolia]